MAMLGSWFSCVLKPVVFVLALLPAIGLGLALWLDKLGANPVEALIRDTGEWALRFLLLTLLLSTLRRWLGWVQGIRLRRMLGLFAFFYAALHVGLYVWLEQFFDWAEIWRDILKRPFITVGMLAFVLLLPLAMTSTQAMMRHLGRQWKRLHTLVYPLSMLAVLHFWWMKDSKADTSAPLIYAVLLAILLGERIYQAYKPGGASKPKT